jgi:hypothetical protein
MGIDIRAKLIYGVDYDELSEQKNLDELLDDGDLDYASPHFDCSRDSWIVGIELPSNIPGEAEMVLAIRTAKVKFEKLTEGMPGRIIVSPDVT